MHNHTHSCTYSSEWNRHPRMSFFRSPKMWKSQVERSGLYGARWSVSQPNLWSLSLTRLAVWGRTLSCKRMIPSDSFRGILTLWRVTASSATNETNHAYLFFFACLHIQCWTNTLYTTLTSRAIKKQFCGSVRFHYVCLLSYRWQYRYVTTVLPAFARNVFYGGCSVFIWLLGENSVVYLRKNRTTQDSITPRFSLLIFL